MPRAPKHCGINGCTTIVPAGQRCHEHKHNWGKGTPRSHTHEHEQWSKAVRDRDKRCMIRIPGCTGGADTADHIKPWHLGGAYTLANGQAACWWCHGRKSSAEGHQARHHKSKP